MTAIVKKSFKCQGKEAYGFCFFLSQKFDKGEHIKRGILVCAVSIFLNSTRRKKRVYSNLIEESIVDQAVSRL